MDNMKLETPAQRIKYVRKLLKMTQHNFAQALGVSTKTMTDCEHGKNRPNFGMLTQLRKIYNVNLDFIFVGLGDPFLTEEKEIVDLSEEGVIKHKEILLNIELRTYLDYLLNSKIVLFNALEYFNTLYRKEHRAINKEMEKVKKK